MIPWQAIDTVLLDMDGTLLDLHFDNHFWMESLPAAYAAQHQLSLPDACAKIHELIHTYDGTLQWYCLDHWSATLQMDIVELKKRTQEKIQLRPYVLPFLQQLKHLGKKIILATNAHRDSLQLKMQCTELAPFFDAQVSSHDYQAAKEHPAFWQALVAAHQLQLARCLFVDDTPRVLQAARLAGVGHLLHINTPDLQKPASPCSDFLSIAHFDEILLPQAAASH
jgi:5'-nucleotidase